MGGFIPEEAVGPPGSGASTRTMQMSSLDHRVEIFEIGWF